MEERSGHITGKVVLGYFLLFFLGACCVTYIFYIMRQVADEDAPDNLTLKKVYLITNTLSLLYESEAIGQLVNIQEDDFQHFNQTLDKAHRNLDSLRVLVTDSLQRRKIAQINVLLERKRSNTKSLLETWEEANTERLFAENIERVITAEPEPTVNQLQIQERTTEVTEDTIVVPRRRRGFFQRLAEVFTPTKGDTTLIVNTTKEIVTDTLVNVFNPTDTIISVLKSIQDSVALRRQQLMDVFLERAADLRYDNTVITNEINQMLRQIEEEEMENSLNRAYNRQELLEETSRLIGIIAIVAVIIAFLFLIVIARDIARGKYYRQQIEKAKSVAERLLQGREKLMLTISHDIRAPLSSIIGYIELLLRRHPDERQQYYLQNMKGSSDHILSLVNDLLDFQRLESGEMEIHSVPFRIPSLMEEIYHSFKPLAESKGLQLTLNVKPEDMELMYMGDPIRIRQIVGNLISNAIKFTDEGQVTLRVKTWKEAKGYQLCIIVSDSGRGIPKEEQKRIFGEFTRLADTDEIEGFGLGLSITHKLTTLMKGHLTLNSTPGKGSDFTITLPLPVAEHQTLPTPTPTPSPSFEGEDVYCLLVDDDPLQLALTEEVLKLSHVQVVGCTNPRNVLEQLKNMHFNAVITDIQMPTMDGYKLLGKIRSSGIPGTDTVPVIALSASIAKDQEHYKEAGFTAFLNKPFTANQLITLLNELLSLQLAVRGGVDFSSLTAFAGEDDEASTTILKTFAQETRKSILRLQTSSDTNDRAEASRVSHKLIPILSMLGANTLTQHLRILEKNDKELTDPEWHRMLGEVIEQTLLIVERAESISDM